MDRATAETSNSTNGTEYTDITLENPDSRPIPTSKRAREEELEKLALEEQRLHVFKLRKEITLIKEPSPADNGDDDEGDEESSRKFERIRNHTRPPAPPEPSRRQAPAGQDPME